MVDLANNLDAEQRRAAAEGLTEDEPALFDLLAKPELTRADRERLKEASKSLLESIKKAVQPLERWTEKKQTQTEVQVVILDHLFRVLPSPAFSDEER